MAVTVRSAISNSGPRSGSSWFTAGENVAVTTAGLTFNTSAGVTAEIPIFQIPAIGTSTGGGPQQDTLASDNIEAYLYGLYLTAQSTLAANTASLTISFSLRRAGAAIGGQDFAGWAAASNPALTAFTPISVPFLTGNTALVAPASPTNAVISATSARLPLQPLDVICLKLINGSAGTIAVPILNVEVDIV